MNTPEAILDIQIAALRRYVYPVRVELLDAAGVVFASYPPASVEADPASLGRSNVRVWLPTLLPEEISRTARVAVHSEARELGRFEMREADKSDGPFFAEFSFG